MIQETKLAYYHYYYKKLHWGITLTLNQPLNTHTHTHTHTGWFINISEFSFPAKHTRFLQKCISSCTYIFEKVQRTICN